MAASSSKCTPEELEKAIADLDDLCARIPDECKCYRVSAEEEMRAKEEREEKERNKKKKRYVVPPDLVQMVLNYKCEPLPERKGLALLDKEKYKDMRTMATVCDTFARHHRDYITTCQEKIRDEYATKGYVTYEATDNEEEEEEEEAMLYRKLHVFVVEERRRNRSGVTDKEEEEDVLYRRFRGGGGGGRRRHRPGVTKSAKGGVVKRLN